MSNNQCPKIEKCPIFQGSSFEGHELSETLQGVYKKSYCLAGNTKYTTCKRYIASETLKMPIPKLIMPNSNRSIEEIKSMIEKAETKE